MNDYKDEDYKNYLKGFKCEYCKKPMRTNKKHINHYRNGFIPPYHKKCHIIADYIDSFKN